MRPTSRYVRVWNEAKLNHIILDPPGLCNRIGNMEPTGLKSLLDKFRAGN
jgi:hypothetical protein